MKIQRNMQNLSWEHIFFESPTPFKTTHWIACFRFLGVQIWKNCTIKELFKDELKMFFSPNHSKTSNWFQGDRSRQLRQGADGGVEEDETDLRDEGHQEGARHRRWGN